MSVLRKKTNFAVVSNSVINCKDLSWKAKGLYAYLCSKSDGWTFYMSEIESNGVDGIDKIRTGLQELERSGFLFRHRINDESTGKFHYDYEIFETPSATSPHRDFPHTENPNAVNPHAENPILPILDLTNTDLTNINSTHSVSFSNTDSIIKYWNQKTGANVLGDPALDRRVVEAVSQFGIEKVKIGIDKYWRYLNDDSFYWSKRFTLFDFLLNKSSSGLAKFIHETDESMKRLEDTKKQISKNDSVRNDKQFGSEKKVVARALSI